MVGLVGGGGLSDDGDAPRTHRRRTRPVPRLSFASKGHDPFWDMDGTGAQRSRKQRRVARYLTWLIGIIVIGVVATRLPSVDAEFLISGAGRPILGGAILALLAASVLLALGKMRSSNHG
jgi:hypothetical protein